MTQAPDLMLSLREQPRTPGAHRTHTLEWVVPQEWKTEVLTLPAGTVVPVEVGITSVEEGVVVTVQTQVTLEGQCVRCLEPAFIPMDIDTGELYTEASSKSRDKKRRSEAQAAGIEVEGVEFDPEFIIDRDHVNVEPLLRDAILADAPLLPVCDRQCEGICEHCGILLRDAGPDHHHEFLDPRFSALQALLKDDNG